MPSSCYQFEEFKLDLKRYELRRNNLVLKLEKIPMELLILLVSRSSELVSREEIVERLWGRDIFVETEHGINTAVRKIRQALGDDPEHSRFIQTVVGKGYRFIAAVNESKDSAEPPTRVEAHPNGEQSPLEPTFANSNQIETQAAIPPPSAAALFRSRTHWFALLGLLLFVSLVLYAALRPPPSTRSLEYVPITSLPGSEGAPSFSPDHDLIAFDYANESGPEIYSKRLDDEKTQRLTDPPEFSACPSWSPDGKLIAYLRGSASAGLRVHSGIYLMNPLGGAKRRLLDVQNVSCRVSWSPDGSSLAYGPAWSDTDTGGIFLVTIDQPVPKKLVSSPPRTVDVSPSFSHDGKKIVFVRNTSLATQDLYVVSTSGGEAQRLTFLNANLGGPAWTSDDKRIIFWGAASGSGWNNDIYSIPATGGNPERLPFATHNTASPAISRDGSRLVFVQFQFDPNIWRVDLGGKAAPQSKVIASTWLDAAPDFSPDGSKISFLSERDGTLAIWICNADGSSPVKLTGVEGPGIPTWSPSGERIVFDSSSNGHHQIYVADARGGNPEQITSGDFNNQTPSWSSDGKWIYFGSDRTGNFEIWKISPESKENIQVTRGGGFYAEESPDGKFIFYNKPHDRLASWTYIKPGIYRMPVNGGPEKLVVPDASWLWRVGKQGVYFMDADSKPRPTLKILRFTTGKIETLAALDKKAWGGPGGIAISRDGKSVLFAQVDSQGSDLMLVKNGSW